MKSLVLKAKDLSAKIPKEAKASTVYTICSVLQQCLSIITLPLFTRILATEEYGLSSVFASTFSLVVVFTTLQLPYGSFNTAMIKYEDDRLGYISSVNGICTFLTIIAFIIYFLFESFWNNLIGIPTLLMVFMLLHALFMTSTTFWISYSKFTYNYKKVAIFTLLSSFISTIITLIIVINSPNKGVVKIIVSSTCTILCGIYFYLWAIRKGKKPFNKEYWKYALSFNIPLIPYYLSTMIFNQSDRLMIDHLCGRSEAGMYSVAYSLSMVLTFIITAINNSYTPWLYRQIKNKEFKKNREIMTGLSLFIALALFMLIFCAPEIIRIMAGNKYDAAIWVVPPVTMSLLYMFLAHLFLNVEFYFQEKKHIVVGSIVSAIVNIVLNALLIPVFGFVVAGYTTLFSYLVLAVMNYYYMKNTCKKNGITENVFNTKIMLVITMVFTMVSLLITGLYNRPVIRYSILLVIVAFAIVCRDRIIIEVKKYRNELHKK